MKRQGGKQTLITLRNTCIHTSVSNFYEDQGERGDMNEVKHQVTNDAWLFQMGEKNNYSTL